MSDKLQLVGPELYITYQAGFADMLKSLLQNSMKTLTATTFQVGKGTLSPLGKSLCSSGDRVPFLT